MANHEELLARLVGFDTTSSRPNRPCIDFIRDYLDGFGIKSSVISGAEDGKACLWATIGPADREGVVLSGHSDVVPVAGQKWTSDPFQLTARDDKLYGRGSCDMKAFIACALAVVPALAKEKLDRPVHLAFTHDEETDMSGAISLTSYMKTNGIKPLWTWIGEPTLLTLVDEHKGVGFIETEITGIPGHSGRPQLGLSAIELGVEYANIIMRVAEKRRGAPITGSRFDPPYTTFNLGTINGGTAENIIAEHFRLIWQIRAHPGDTLINALDEVEKIAHAEIAPRFRAFAPKAGMKTCACLDIPPLLPSPHNPGCDILKRLTGNTETGAVSFGTEAGFFQQLGAPVVICGPGNIEQAHKADEFVSREQLASCVTLLQKTLAETTRAN